MWRRQQLEVGMKPDWKRVRGPAGAVVMCMERADWKWPAWHTMMTRQGFMLDLREVCPMDVASMLKLDVQAVLWAAWGGRLGCGHASPLFFSFCEDLVF